MKKLTDEEFNKMVVKASGGGRESEGYSAILSLAVGESLHITKTEWKLRTTPLACAMRIEKRYGYKYNKYTLADGSGWIIKRMK